MYNTYFYHFCIIYHACYLVNLHKENELFFDKTVHFLSSLVNLFTKLIFNNPIISAVIRIMISYYRKIIAEPFQRYKHNERCQIIMKSHSKVCIIQNNCCPLPLLNKLKGSLCNHSGGICRNQKQKRNTGFYNLPLFFFIFLSCFICIRTFSSTSPIAFLNKSMSRPSVEKDPNLFLCAGSFFFCIFLYICRCHLFNMSFFQAQIHNFPKNSIDH